MALLRTSDGVIHRLSGDSVSIGRDPANDIALHDGACSARHAQFVSDGAGWRVDDRGSRNGTFVNGERVQTARLNQGDRIQVGATEMTFDIEVRSPHGLDGGSGDGSGYASSYLQSMASDDEPGSESSGSVWERSLLIEDEPEDESESRLEVRPIDPALPTAVQTMMLTASARAAGKVDVPTMRRRPNESLAEAKLRLIQKVSEKLVRIFDPKQLLDEILAIVIEQTGADRGLLCLLDDQRRPVPIAAHGLAEGQQVRVSRTVLKTLLERRSGVLIQQAAARKHPPVARGDERLLDPLRAALDGREHHRHLVARFDLGHENLHRGRSRAAVGRGPSGGDRHRTRPLEPACRDGAASSGLSQQVSR